MSREGDGSPRPSGVSRRRLLAGIGGIGAAGMASGLGTGAYLADRETFANNGFGAGTVELLVNGKPTSGTFAVDISGIDRGDSSAQLSRTPSYEIGAQTNPVRVWLATKCVPSDPLSRELEVNVLVDGMSITGGYSRLVDVRDELHNGDRIDTGCLDPEDTVLVEVEWELPTDAADVGGETTDLTFQLYAEQCRHTDEADAEAVNPFANRVCEENQCVPCEDENGVKIGGLTLRYLGDETLDPLIVRAAGGGGGGNGRGNGNNPPTTIFDATVQPNEEFVLDGADSGTKTQGWIGPNIYLDSDGDESRDRDSETTIHTSCSVPLGPGDVYGDFEVVAVTTTDGEDVCGTGTGGDGGDGGDGDDTPDDEPEPECVVCDKGTDTKLATLDVRYLGQAAIDLTVRATGGGAGGPGTGGTTIFDDTVQPNAVFVLDGANAGTNTPGWIGTNVYFDDGSDGGNGNGNGNNGNGNGGGDRVTGFKLHTSCSEPIAVGMTFGDDDEFEIVAATATTGESLCGSEAN